MKGWLLDTNVISELRKPRCNLNLKNWSDSQPPQSFYLSTVTMAEIRFGIERTQKDDFREALISSSQVAPLFSRDCGSGTGSDHVKPKTTCVVSRKTVLSTLSGRVPAVKPPLQAGDISRSN